MRLERLKLSNFRNYQNLDIELHPRLNLIIGQNAQGKSNILEAIALTLTGQSFRPGENKDFINAETSVRYGHIQVAIHQQMSSHSIEMKMSEDNKESYLNNKKTTRTDLRKRFSTVIFSPDSLSVIKQGPNERRMMLDDIMCSLASHNSRVISEFNRCLRTRNKIIKNWLSEAITKTELESLMGSINPTFITKGTILANTRIETIKNILPRVKATLRLLLGREDVDISVDYVISGKSAIDWSQNQVYDALKTRLEGLSAAELRSGQSLVGPHKHDIRFLLNGQDARYYCSQGQQRAIALAFKIAHIMQHFEINNEYPVLLLDDVFSELDSEKRVSLLKILSETPAQIFITATELDDQNLFGSQEKNIFEVVKGNVTTGWI